MSTALQDAQLQVKTIGEGLDAHLYPRAFIGGIIRPVGPSKHKSYTGEVFEHAKRQRSSRPTTRPWERTERWKRASSRQRPTGSPAFHRSTKLRELYESQIGAILAAYPETIVIRSDDGLWLIVESEVVNGLGQKALFVVAVPYFIPAIVKGWAFWYSTLGIQWIGPRHTNFPDGSICAFDPNHATWSIGDDLVVLLDLYSVWAVRHKFFELYGYWPGNQAATFVYERLDELRDNEICGCDTQFLSYASCCKQSDSKLNKLMLAVEYHVHICGGGVRVPPIEITELAYSRLKPPELYELTRIHISDRELLVNPGQ